MARMMKAQMDYALERLEHVCNQKLGKEPCEDRTELRKAHADLLRSGKIDMGKVVKAALVQFDREVRLKCYHYPATVESHVEDRLSRHLADAHNDGTEAERKKWSAKRDKLMVHFQQAKDELILGDVEKALALIDKFAKLKV